MPQRTHAIKKVGEACPEAEHCHHLDDSAERAVRKVFAILGVDIDKPESVAEFQEYLRFGKKLRKAADHGMLALVGVVVAALMAAAWAGVQAKLGVGG